MTRCHYIIHLAINYDTVSLIGEEVNKLPKQTFFQIPKEKQDTLIQAAKEEFSRVPLHEASIANIVKSAGIPRGSFYQYFEDKEDLFYYLTNQLIQRNNERFITILKDKNGDIFEAFIELFQLVIKNQREQEYKNFFKNVFLNMNYKLENKLADHMYENKKKQYQNILALINRDQLNIKDEGELRQVVKILRAITSQNFVQVFGQDLTNEEALNNYMAQIELLKRGLCKKEYQVKNTNEEIYMKEG